MKTRLFLSVTAISTLVLMGSEIASAQIPWCPPFCVVKADSKSKETKAPKAQKPKKEKKTKKESA